MQKELMINDELITFDIINTERGVEISIDGSQFVFNEILGSDHPAQKFYNLMDRNVFSYASENSVSVDHFDLKVVDPKTIKRKAGANVEAGSMLSPMPGKILKVICKEGDNVKMGDTILVMEAMKMEHSIKASNDGVVAKVHFNEGDLVDGDVVLCQVDANELKD